MSENQRKYPRKEIHVDVSLSYLDNEPVNVCTRDMSEGGMFLVVTDTSTYPLGEMVHLNYNNPSDNNSYIEKDAIIVRVADDGLGVAFVELDAF